MENYVSIYAITFPPWRRPRGESKCKMREQLNKSKPFKTLFVITLATFPRGRKDLHILEVGRGESLERFHATRDHNDLQFPSKVALKVQDAFSSYEQGLSRGKFEVLNFSVELNW